MESCELVPCRDGVAAALLSGSVALPEQPMRKVMPIIKGTNSWGNDMQLPIF